MDDHTDIELQVLLADDKTAAAPRRLLTKHPIMGPVPDKGRVPKRRLPKKSNQMS